MKKQYALPSYKYIGLHTVAILNKICINIDIRYTDYVWVFGIDYIYII